MCHCWLSYAQYAQIYVNFHKKKKVNPTIQYKMVIELDEKKSMLLFQYRLWNDNRHWQKIGNKRFIEENVTNTKY